jgi:ArsR family transcriptional regulator, arsenate/arsenite/antimonite-responsive transcriptional repressor
MKRKKTGRSTVVLNDNHIREQSGEPRTAFAKESKIFKALSEPVRLQIIDLISCGELCACEILDYIAISQSTLSHHMKVLIECGLVSNRKDATWMYYTINREGKEDLHRKIDGLMDEKETCVCFSFQNRCKD